MFVVKEDFWLNGPFSRMGQKTRCFMLHDKDLPLHHPTPTPCLGIGSAQQRVNFQVFLVMTPPYEWKSLKWTFNNLKSRNQAIYKLSYPTYREHFDLAFKILFKWEKHVSTTYMNVPTNQHTQRKNKCECFSKR